MAGVSKGQGAPGAVGHQRCGAQLKSTFDKDCVIGTLLPFLPCVFCTLMLFLPCVLPFGRVRRCCSSFRSGVPQIVVRGEEVVGVAAAHMPCDIIPLLQKFLKSFRGCGGY